MDILNKEVFSKQVQIGQMVIEFAVIDKEGCRVTFTAKDDENRRLWRTELTDPDGNVKIYPNVQEAIAEGNQKLKHIEATCAPMPFSAKVR